MAATRYGSQLKSFRLSTTSRRPATLPKTRAQKNAEYYASIRAANAAKAPAQAQQANQQLANQLKAAQDAANAANRIRFGQALQEQKYAATRMREQFDIAKRGLSTMGQAATANIRVGAQRTAAASRQQMMSSGLSGTTAVAAAGRRVGEEENRAMLGVQEMQQQAMTGLASQQAGLEFQTGQARTGLLSSFQEQGPNLGMYAGLLQQGGAFPGTGVSTPGAGPMPPGAGGTDLPTSLAGQIQNSPFLQQPNLSGMRQQAQFYATGGSRPGTSSLAKAGLAKEWGQVEDFDPASRIFQATAGNPSPNFFQSTRKVASGTSGRFIY